MLDVQLFSRHKCTFSIDVQHMYMYHYAYISHMRTSKRVRTCTQTSLCSHSHPSLLETPTVAFTPGVLTCSLVTPSTVWRELAQPTVLPFTVDQKD